MVILFGILRLAAAGGCAHSPELAAPEPPALQVSHPVSREVTDYVDFTGHTDAIQVVDIRARVSGYLVQMPFNEGAEIKRGICCSRSTRVPSGSRAYVALRFLLI
jgi:multidrug efflux pump subunit AcrA (membrane-fusion protein)